MDDYMDGIAIDLSRATFIFSFNDKNKVSPILLDRMEIIKFNSYSNKEKMVIARDFLLPNVVKNVFNDDSIRVDISDANMLKIVCNGSFVKKRFNYGGPSPQDPLVPAGSFMKKRFNKNGSRFSKVMKKCKRKGGVRYIKKILERIVSRINLQLFQKKPRQKQKSKLLTVNNKILNEILSNK
jgi:ATP-dependent Lon protease